MTPRPSGVVRSRSAIVELGLAEELGAAAVLELDELAQQHADVADDSPPMPSSSALPASLVEEREQRAQVGRGRAAAGPSRRRSGRRARGLLCVSFALEHLGQQLRAEVGDRGAHRDARARCRRATGTRPGSRAARTRDRARPSRFAAGPPGSAGRRQPGEVALHVGGEHRHAGRRELLGQELQGLRLARCPSRRR